jgi:ADP-heptose:LPS heptosyltransferase
MLDQQLKLLDHLLGESPPETLPASYSGFDLAVPDLPLGIGKIPYIVVHMGPRNFRGWVPEKWIALASALRGPGFELVLTGGPGEEKEAARLLGEAVPVKDLTDRLSWEQFVATVAKATAIVTIDSVAGHVAACFGVPTVVLFAGRQRLNLWRPNSPNAIALTHAVGCAPCHRTNGCAAMACVQHIEVEDVLSSLRRVAKCELSSNPRS